MSHTTIIHYGAPARPIDEWVVHHNGDYSGDVEFVIKESDRIELFENPKPHYLVSIPFSVIEELVGQAYISSRISYLESLSGKELLHRLNNND